VAFSITNRDRKIQANVVGTTASFFTRVNLEVEPGGRPLVEEDIVRRNTVCVIGSETARHLFPLSDPIGETVLAESGQGSIPYRVVGVLSPIKTAGAPARGTRERNFNVEMYIPLSTADSHFGDSLFKRTSGRFERLNIELSDLYIVVDDVEHVLAVSDMVERIFETTHDKQDYEIRVPLASLELAKKKKRDQQIVLGIIAAVSLVVGGIGIMNIMLATVTERTREIGVRRALGAKQRHIVGQFLVETVVLSMTGGLIGIALGWGSAHLINWWVNWETIVHAWTVVVSFGLSVTVGILFGIYPAIRASQLDPIEALRYE
jgi:putative ABC transport system permease protein